MRELGSAVVLVTGVMASGKSTVAQAPAERTARSVHLRGDAFRRMIVSGRKEFTPRPGPEAVARREADRPKSGYGGPWTIGALDDALRRDTPRRGLWLDTSDETPEQTVDRILADLGAARITG